MQFRLVIEKNGKRSRAVQLSATPARIGRAHGNAVRIPSSEVSRRHCEVREDDGLLKIEDLESVNGTYLNGDLITGEAVVRPGDRLQIGPVTFVVEYELTPDAVERLRAMDNERVVVAEDAAPIEVNEPVVDEEIAFVEDDEEEPLPAEEVAEAQDYDPRFDLDDVKWGASGDGDLRDLLSHLDEGQESMHPPKRPAPRTPKGKPRPTDKDE